MRKYIIAALFALCALAAPSMASAADPVTCAGYPQARTYLGAQDWWPNPGHTNADPSHVHLEACAPNADQAVSGVLHLDFVVKLHANESATLRSVKAHGRTDSGDSAYSGNVSSLTFKCPATSPGDCSTVVPYNFDTATIPYDGLQELRTKARIEISDGSVQLPVLRHVINVRNGKTVNDYDNRRPQGIGWRNGMGYASAGLDSGVPLVPVSGVWTPRVSFFQFDNFEAPLISLNITHAFISVDPDFHASPPNPGLVIHDANTTCAIGRTRCNGPYKQLFNVDTTLLANGPHKLFIRADAIADSTTGSADAGKLNAGALVVPFTVAN